MKPTLRKILGPFAVIWFISLFIAGFVAYFVTTAGTGGPTDGFGRSLSEAPVLMRIFCGQEKMWAGWGWFVGDMIIFWGSIALAITVSKWLED